MATAYGVSFQSENYSGGSSSGQTAMIIPSQTFVGRSSPGTGLYETLSISTSKQMLSLNNVENTALSTWPGTTNITTLGTISSGTWAANTIPINRGGTNNTSTYNTNAVMFYDGTKINGNGNGLRWDNTNSGLGVNTNSTDFPTINVPIQISSLTQFNVPTYGRPDEDATGINYHLLTAIQYNVPTGCDFRISGLLSGHRLVAGKATIDVTFSIRNDEDDYDKPRITGIVHGSILESGTMDLLIYKNAVDFKYYIYVSGRRYALSNLTLQRGSFNEPYNGPFLFSNSPTQVAPNVTNANNVIWYKLSTGLQPAAFSGSLPLMYDGVMRNSVEGNLTLPGTIQCRETYVSKNSLTEVTLYGNDPQYIGVTPSASPHTVVTLPEPAMTIKGKVFHILDEAGTAGSSSQKIVVSGKINGLVTATVNIQTAYGYARFITNGTIWFRIA